MKNPDVFGCLSVRETARRIGCHENTVRTLVNTGKLKARRLPHSNFRRIPEEEVERYIKERDEKRRRELAVETAELLGYQ